jgi:thioredoxin-like negative regulator of GroEL
MTVYNQDRIEFKRKLAAAKRHIDADQFAEAATIYEQLLVEEPDEPDLCHTLGLVYLEQGRNVYRSIGDALNASGRLVMVNKKRTQN